MLVLAPATCCLASVAISDLLSVLCASIKSNAAAVGALWYGSTCAATVLPPVNTHIHVQTVAGAREESAPA